MSTPIETTRQRVEQLLVFAECFEKDGNPESMAGPSHWERSESEVLKALRAPYGERTLHQEIICQAVQEEIQTIYRRIAIVARQHVVQYLKEVERDLEAFTKSVEALRKLEAEHAA